jgi:hypothetical protein
VHGPKAVIALQAIARCSKWVPMMRLADGTPKLAGWGFLSREGTDLFEPADYFAYALLQAYRDQNSLKAKLCNLILDASGGDAYGAILGRGRIREIVGDSLLLAALLDAQERLANVE